MMFERGDQHALHDRPHPSDAYRVRFTFLVLIFALLDQPSSFLMFCTEGREMFSAWAISVPVLSWPTIAFIFALVSGVIVARGLRTPGRR